ncbi:hypothetical protein BDP55DRAFT_696836 [Colletotrichum godetiae]|uniref:Uncharacterized protein n=1 Tax=Colletotrichum godetiae TaxID=1209918 RepID=A0AAJ0ACI8_9PEZI|nr:uncharacterized protein BDP55DRAFT_696836 [Colletotrichum godetiae]KAK1671400.1 hypothetical protein BDP55DRAFT_696836 [Colletotrichum godetiae]
MITLTHPFSLALRTMWPPSLLAAIFTLFITPLQTVFYRADLSMAYHVFAAASIYFSLTLNAAIVMTPLRSKFQEIKRNDEVFSQIGTFNRWLVEGYLHSFFLFPNLFGPIIACWIIFPDNRYFDNLAHLYGFVVGIPHRRAPTSRLVWAVSDYIPRHPCESTQKFLLALHVCLEELPDTTVAAIDRKLLCTEWVFLQLVVGFAFTSLVCMLYTMVVEAFRLYLQRLVVYLTAEILLYVGDFGLVVRQSVWEDMNL